MRTTPRRLLALLPILALASCGSAPAPTTGEHAAPADVQVAALGSVNQYRAAAGLAGVALSHGPCVSAVKHAGYQAIRSATYPGDFILTHYESSDHPPVKDGTPDTGNPLYVAVNVMPRMVAANGGQFYSTGITIFSEDITSVSAGYLAVNSLWNTVYHRLPMCRHETKFFGYGDAETARLQYPAAGVPNVSGWGTLDFVGRGGTTVTASFWPGNNGKFVVGSFDTDTEHPDPLDGANPGQSPVPAPNAGTVGNPLHFIVPASADWTSVTVTLNAAATPATQLPVYVLAGYLKLDPFNPQDHVASPPPPGALPGGVTAWDDELDAGELFVLPQSPLAPGGVAYEYSISGTAGASFTTGAVTFSTK